jgi:hypothetical protein
MTSGTVTLAQLVLRMNGLGMKTSDEQRISNHRTPHSPHPESDGTQGKPARKQRIVHELTRYWINVMYLAVFFGAFAWYRRFILDEYRISYFNYGSAVIEALILAKVIWLGDFLGLSEGLENKPLFYPTLYKAFVFSCFVGLFAVVEHIVSGLLHGKGVIGGLAMLWNEGKYELLARCLVNFLAFIPFFAFRELAKVLGEGRLNSLFFRRRLAA